MYERSCDWILTNKIITLEVAKPLLKIFALPHFQGGAVYDGPSKRVPLVGKIYRWARIPSGVPSVDVETPNVTHMMNIVIG